jgi:hypothetical protein
MSEATVGHLLAGAMMILENCFVPRLVSSIIVVFNWISGAGLILGAFHRRLALTTTLAANTAITNEVVISVPLIDSTAPQNCLLCGRIYD